MGRGRGSEAETAVPHSVEKPGADVFAALAQVRPEVEPYESDGSVIITGPSYSGMVDIHDRRPLVLSSDHAKEWINSCTTKARADAITLTSYIPTALIEWFKVNRTLCNIRNKDATIIMPAT